MVMFRVVLLTVALGGFGCFRSDGEIGQVYRPGADAMPDGGIEADGGSPPDGAPGSPDGGVAGSCDWRATPRPYGVPDGRLGIQRSVLAIRPGRGDGAPRWTVWGLGGSDASAAIVRFGLDPSSREPLEAEAICDVSSRATWTLCPDGPERAVALSPMYWGDMDRVVAYEGYTLEQPDRGAENGRSMTLVPPAEGEARPSVYYNHEDPASSDRDAGCADDAGVEPLCMPENEGCGAQLVTRPVPGDDCDTERVELITASGLEKLNEPVVARRGDALCVVGHDLFGGALFSFSSAGDDEVGDFVDGEVTVRTLDGCYRPSLFDLGDRWLVGCAQHVESDPLRTYRMAFFTSADCRAWSPVDTDGLGDVLDLGSSLTASVSVAGPGDGAVVVWTAAGRVVLTHFDGRGRLLGHAVHGAENVAVGDGGPSVGKRGDEYLVAWNTIAGVAGIERFEFVRWTCVRE